MNRSHVKYAKERVSDLNVSEDKLYLSNMMIWQCKRRYIIQNSYVTRNLWETRKLLS